MIAIEVLLLGNTSVLKLMTYNLMLFMNNGRIIIRNVIVIKQYQPISAFY